MRWGIENHEAGTLLDMVTFRLLTRSYAILLEHISGMTPAGTCRKVPGCPPGVLGLAEWKGRVLTVLDLPVLVSDGPTGEPASMVRMARPYGHTALYVPATVRIDAMEAHTLGELSEDAGARKVPHPGKGPGVVMLEPRSLVERLEAEILGDYRRGFPEVDDEFLAAGGP